MLNQVFNLTRNMKLQTRKWKVNYHNPQSKPKDAKEAGGEHTQVVTIDL